jgi:hypothetical protein
MSSTSELDDDADGDSAGRDGDAAMPEFDVGVAPDNTRQEESCEHFRTISKKVFERLAASAL